MDECKNCKRLRKVIDAYETLCIAYRVGGRRTPEKALDTIRAYKDSEEDRKNNPASTTNPRSRTLI